MSDIPSRCIDPVIKFCQECTWGHNIYPGWVETREDLEYCTFETVCTLGYDKGRPEDEPTEEEIKEFITWWNKTYPNEKCLTVEEYMKRTSVNHFETGGNKN